MSLADTVAEIRAGDNIQDLSRFPQQGELDTSKLNLVIGSLSIETAQQRILQAFNIREKLVELRDNFWQSGHLTNTNSGISLRVSFEEIAARVEENVRIPATLGSEIHRYRYSTGQIDQSFGYYASPVEIPEHWETQDTGKCLASVVHHNIVAEVTEEPYPIHPIHEFPFNLKLQVRIDSPMGIASRDPKPPEQRIERVATHPKSPYLLRHLDEWKKEGFDVVLYPRNIGLYQHRYFDKPRCVEFVKFSDSELKRLELFLAEYVVDTNLDLYPLSSDMEAARKDLLFAEVNGRLQD